MCSSGRPLWILPMFVVVVIVFIAVVVVILVLVHVVDSDRIWFSFKLGLAVF